MKWLFGLSVLVLSIQACSAHADDRIALEQQHKGINLIAIKADPNKRFDTKLLPADQALRSLAKALDRLTAKSPLSRRKLKALKKSGWVGLVYLPDDLGQGPSSGLTLAKFVPDFLSSSATKNREKIFLVVVGRHGIKWPVDELAAILAHELVGHGIQHRRNRLMTIRLMDAECEAHLYQEAASQDLGLDKRSREMVAFRRSLEQRWCADFKIYLREHQPATMPLWDTLNPDIPKLLAAFDKYLEYSSRKGVTGKSIAAADAQRKEKRGRILKDAPPDDVFQFALKLHNGGIGVQKDKGEALRYFKMAAEGGHDKAQLLLGEMYATGSGVAKDYAEAARWYHKAAEQGVAKAQTDIGLLYVKGSGVEKDYAKAAHWFGKAVKQNDVRAHFYLATINRRGLGREKDHVAAAEGYRRGAEAGHSKSQYRLGWYLYRGIGVAKDYQESAKWIGEAAAAGHAQSQHSLGWMYTKGNGVSKDPAQAAVWFRKAAEQGHPDAQARLGWLHMKGPGVTKDKVESYVWYSLAVSNAKAGKKMLKIAKKNRGIVAKSLTPDQLSEAKQRIASRRTQ